MFLSQHSINMFLAAKKRDSLVFIRAKQQEENKKENHLKFSPVYINKKQTLRPNIKEYDKQAKLF